jgi:FkbM family methyltransferase
MTDNMSLLNKLLIKASGNRFLQNILEKNIQASQELMGIGSGGGVSNSGEKAIFNILREKFEPPYCIFDVGSNKGQFLQLALDNMKIDNFSVHCFEPGRETFKMLAENSKGNEKIKLNNIGIGKEKGEAILHFDSAGSGLASLTRRRLDHFNIYFEKSEKVEINTIDNYCMENAINHIHLLKLDIEGHELDALAGARNMFDTKSIDIVTFEFGGCNIDTRTFFQDFWYYFNEINMSIYRITPSGYLYPLQSYKEIYEQFRTINFIAISNVAHNTTTTTIHS